MNYLIPVFENADFENIIEQKEYLENFKGEAKQSVFWISPSGDKYYILGLGKNKDSASVITGVRSFFFKNKKNLSGEVTIKLLNDEISSFVSEITQGIELGKYEIGHLKTDAATEDWYSRGNTYRFEGAANEEAIQLGKQLAETRMKIMHWGDAPANYKIPQMIAGWIKESGKQYGYEVSLMDHKDLKKSGFDALLAVGRGGEENRPVFCLMEYKHPEAKKTIALVGKGVTFDTGGVSLKPGQNMNYMKSDMGGAAAVAGTMEMVAKLKLPVHLIGAVPLTENLIGSYAIKPGDVIKSYSGKTIEVINTDAEGRLILADALSYVTDKYKADILIDLATLTGNAIVALGNQAAALVSPNDELAETLFQSGMKTGEKVWRMPHWDDYKGALKSDIADLKNLSDSPKAGAVNAAKFLEVFTRDHKAWAHLDIAGTAFDDSEFGSMKSATGYGVSLLLDFINKEIA